MAIWQLIIMNLNSFNSNTVVISTIYTNYPSVNYQPTDHEGK